MIQITLTRKMTKIRTWATMNRKIGVVISMMMSKMMMMIQLGKSESLPLR
jgi:hypothetical protein